MQTNLHGHPPGAIQARKEKESRDTLASEIYKLPYNLPIYAWT